ncbi:MAG: PEP-CTERM sorting domain-containing protein [Verrucomicrobiaceae bacterium]|nr:PEP-CTERM sorting domain-containing protein [Verrucomicrobiaceae bacterium]
MNKSIITLLALTSISTSLFARVEWSTANTTDVVSSDISDGWVVLDTNATNTTSNNIHVSVWENVNVNATSTLKIMGDDSSMTFLGNNKITAGGLYVQYHGKAYFNNSTVEASTLSIHQAKSLVSFNGGTATFDKVSQMDNNGATVILDNGASLKTGSFGGTGASASPTTSMLILKNKSSFETATTNYGKFNTGIYLEGGSSFKTTEDGIDGAISLIGANITVDSGSSMDVGGYIKLSGKYSAYNGTQYYPCTFTIGANSTVKTGNYIQIADNASLVLNMSGANQIDSDVTIETGGVFNIYATSALTSGQSYDVLTGTLSNNGTINVYGGTLNGKVFTVSESKQIEAGVEVPTVVENNGIVEITTNENTSVSMAFNADSATVNKVVENTVDLVSAVGSDFVKMGAYEFDVEIEEGDTVVLSFYVGDSSLKTSDFSIFHKSEGGQWSKADDVSGISYDGEFLSFVVSHFSSYGYTAVPEPSTYAIIFGALALSFVIYRRRK